MLYCFLDTNIFLEFRPLKEIPWCKELDTTEICLVVTSVVMRELDKHKSSNSRRKSTRAQDALRFLENADVSGNLEIFQNVSLHFESPEPNQVTLDANNLSTSVPDDILIAKAIEFAALNQSHTIAVVSGDFGVRLKARRVNLCVPILDKFRLDPETDPLEKENRELRNENIRLQNTQPKLKIGFPTENGETSHIKKVSMSFQAELITDEEIESALTNEFKKLKYKPTAITDRRSPMYGLQIPNPWITGADVEKYHRRLRSWLRLYYRNYLIEDSLFRIFQNQCVKLELALENSGSSPAKDIEIILTIHNCIGAVDTPLESPSYPYDSKPDTPEMSKQSEILRNFSGSYPHAAQLWYSSNVSESVPEPMPLDTPSKHTLTFYLQQLMHHRSIELEEHFLIVDKPDRFPLCVMIEYEVVAENMIDRVTGELKIIINEDTK